MSRRRKPGTQPPPEAGSQHAEAAPISGSDGGRVLKKSGLLAPRRLVLWTAVLVVPVIALALAWVEHRRTIRVDLLRQLPTLDESDVDPLLATELRQRVRDVTDSPDDGECWGRLGMLLRGNQFAAEASICFSQAAALSPADFRWPYLQGVSRESEAPTEAIRLFEQSLRCREQLFVRLRLAESLLRLRRLDEAAGVLEPAAETSPQDARLQLNMARLGFLQGQFSESLEWAERAANTVPDHRLPRLQLAEIHHRLGQTAAAEEQNRILDSLKDGPVVWPDPVVEEVLGLQRTAGALAEHARQRLNQNDSAGAIAALEAAVSMDPQIAENIVDLATLLIQSGQLNRAEDVLTQAVDRHPGSAEIRHFRAVVAYRKRDWETAARLFQDVIRSHPDFAMAHFNLGQSLEKLGRRAEAIKAFRQSLSLQPDFAEATKRLADLELPADISPGSAPDPSGNR